MHHGQLDTFMLKRDAWSFFTLDFIASHVTCRISVLLVSKLAVKRRLAQKVHDAHHCVHDEAGP